MSPEPAYLSISAYSRTYGVSRNTVYRLLEEGRLETWRVLTLIRIKNVPPDRHTPHQGEPHV